MARVLPTMTSDGWQGNALPMDAGAAEPEARREDGGPGLRRAVIAVVVMAIALRLWAYSPFDLSHADELMQYLEQGNRLVTGSGIVPWEARTGLRNALIPQLLAGPLWLGHVLAPTTLFHVHLARLTFLALTLVALAGGWQLGRLTSWRHGWLALFVVAVWWESILFSNLLLSESLAGAVLLLASAFMLERGSHRGRSTWAGLLLGLGVLVRLQYAPFAVVLLVWALARDKAKSRAVLLGLAGAAVIGAGSDLLAGRIPYAWVLVNFGKNIGEGIAARFSASPPWQYLLELYLHLGPGALLLVAVGAIAAGRRYRPLLAAAIVNIAVHSLIAHKEYRFIWLSTLVLLVLAAIGSLRIVEHLLERRGKQGLVGWPAILGVAGAWALLSLSSFAVTGGYGAFRGGGALTRLAIAASQHPEVCRLAVDDSYRAYVAPSVLPKPLPLSITPRAVAERGAPFPAELARSANALLAEYPPLGVRGYARIACEHLPGEQPCLYVRPGGCTLDGRYGYQQVLESEGL